MFLLLEILQQSRNGWTKMGSMSDDECLTLLDLSNQPSNSYDRIEPHFQGIFNIISIVGSHSDLLLSYNLDAYSCPYVHARTLRYLGNPPLFYTKFVVVGDYNRHGFYEGFHPFCVMASPHFILLCCVSKSRRMNTSLPPIVCHPSSHNGPHKV